MSESPVLGHICFNTICTRIREKLCRQRTRTKLWSWMGLKEKGSTNTFTYNVCTLRIDTLVRTQLHYTTNNCLVVCVCAFVFSSCCISVQSASFGFSEHMYAYERKHTYVNKRTQLRNCHIDSMACSALHVTGPTHTHIETPRRTTLLWNDTFVIVEDEDTSHISLSEPVDFCAYNPSYIAQQMKCVCIRRCDKQKTPFM